MDAWVISGSIGPSAVASAPATVVRLPAARRSSSTVTTGVAASSAAPPRSTTGAGWASSVRSATRCPAASWGCRTDGDHCTSQPCGASSRGRSSSWSRYCHWRPWPRSQVTSTEAVAWSVACRSCPTVAVSPTGASAVRADVSSSDAPLGSSVAAAAAVMSPADQAVRYAATALSGPFDEKKPQPDTSRASAATRERQRTRRTVASMPRNRRTGGGPLNMPCCVYT